MPSHSDSQIMTCVMQSIAPLLIIFRVAEGKAWSSKTERMLTLTNINFTTQNTHSEHHGGSGSVAVPLNTFNTPEADAYINFKGTDNHSSMVSDRIAVKSETAIDMDRFGPIVSA